LPQQNRIPALHTNKLTVRFEPVPPPYFAPFALTSRLCVNCISRKGAKLKRKTQRKTKELMGIDVDLKVERDECDVKNVKSAVRRASGCAGYATLPA
jgi:hypothetical protein